MQKLAKEQGTTILLVTHDRRIWDVADREAWAMPSRIVHLEDGCLAQNDAIAVGE